MYLKGTIDTRGGCFQTHYRQHQNSDAPTMYSYEIEGHHRSFAMDQSSGYYPRARLYSFLWKAMGPSSTGDSTNLSKMLDE